MPTPTEVERFLKTVVTTPEGWFNLLIGREKPNFHEEWYKWPGDLPKILSRVQEAAKTDNVYFSPHLFDKQSSDKVNVIETRTVAADLDHAEVSELVVAPTILVETSPGRHQAYWVMRDPTPLNDLESFSRRMTYSITDCDHSGWNLGHRFRVPGTFNYKYRQASTVNVVGTSMRSYVAEDLETYFARRSSSDGSNNGGSSLSTPTSTNLVAEWHPVQPDKGPQALFEDFRRSLRTEAAYMNTPVGPTDAHGEGRSGALWALMQGLFRAGATRDEVYYLAKNSANNKFADSKYHAEEDLKKDVLRAERVFRLSVRSLKELIQQLMLGPGTKAHKQVVIAGLVREDMDKTGDFVVTGAGRSWYLRKDTGRPITLSRNSEYFQSLLETRYGLNQADPMYSFVVNHLASFTLERGRTAREATLSYFDGSTIILHGGRQDVWLVTRDSVVKGPDGQYGVLFPWRSDDGFDLEPALVEDDWAAFMFDGFFHNLVELDPPEATILMRVWVLFCLMRDQAIGRPILALFGMPGSGKSTLFRLLYALMYGASKSVNVVTTAENYDHLVSVDAFVVFDGVDSHVPWLADRLSTSAAASDFVKRKLYTDADTATQRRNALIGISAHNPRFGREDVVDRMIMLNFARFDEFLDETPIFMRIVKHRNRIWGSIVRDLQKVLGTPMPRADEAPQMRVLDFSIIGLRIARAVGQEAQFIRAVTKVKGAQTRFNLSEEDLLVEIIQKWHANPTRKSNQEYAPGRLWEEFSTYDDNFARTYKTPSIFSRKLWTMAESLKSVFDVTYRIDGQTGTRRWTIEPKLDSEGAPH